MADESLRDLADAERLIESGAARIFNVRLGKNGGVWAAHRLCARAREAGIGLHLGTMVGETGVLSRASEVFGRCESGFDCLDGKGQNAFLLEVDILGESGHHRGQPTDVPDDGGAGYAYSYFGPAIGALGKTFSVWERALGPISAATQGHVTLFFLR